MKTYLALKKMLTKVQGGFNSRSTLRALLSQAIRISDCQNLVGRLRRGFKSHARMSMIFPKTGWSESDYIEATIKDS